MKERAHRTPWWSYRVSDVIWTIECQKVDGQFGTNKLGIIMEAKAVNKATPSVTITNTTQYPRSYEIGSLTNELLDGYDMNNGKGKDGAAYNKFAVVSLGEHRVPRLRESPSFPSKVSIQERKFTFHGSKTGLTVYQFYYLHHL
ncbi:hypothetical protein FEM48_Zijuj09G0190800 [Ziziphus jujuba var. spinosa]|uniref:Uncharacterized protein n=1 Tax=Ziziphus jujuba var. spinosa TaxID=714518 RepID=A0A978UUS3_ZIZJJ|nr:hypothetical protein FEM48_Zijuj09G0190800 [Ziziphus jujuba var. spinosa]